MRILLVIVAGSFALLLEPPARPVSSSNIAIDSSGHLAAIANPDSNSVSLVSVAEDRFLAEIAVAGDPRAVAWTNNRNYLLAVNQASSSVSIIHVPSLRVVHGIDVDAEPYGIVVHPSGAEAYVASAALDVVDVIQLSLDIKQVQGRVIRRIPVGPQPKGLALTADGRRLYVSHFLSGNVSVIDTDSGDVIHEVSTGADSNMAQKIAVHPLNGRAYLPHIRSNVGNRFLLFDTATFPTLSEIDLGMNHVVSGARIDLSIGLTSVNLPFDIAFSHDGQIAYIVNLGSEDVVAVNLATAQRTGRVDVGHGPRGIAIGPDGTKAYVSNTLSDDVSVLQLPSMTELKRIRVTSSPLDPQILRGKILFFSSRGTDISRDRWMSCATCHFEAEHDGRTWTFTAGPRNTTSLRGIVNTHPLHWSADRDEVQDFEHTILQLQAGSGLVRDAQPNPELGATNAGLSADLDALAAFVNSLNDKPSPFVSKTIAEQIRINQGRTVFHRNDVGCAQCHTGPAYTDSKLSARPFVVHDVGTGDHRDERMGPAFDTPTLRGIWQSSPYLHDGSAVTLRDVLTTRNPEDRHGRTSHLSEAELSSLIAFLMSL